MGYEAAPSHFTFCLCKKNLYSYCLIYIELICLQRRHTWQIHNSCKVLHNLMLAAHRAAPHCTISTSAEGNFHNLVSLQNIPLFCYPTFVSSSCHLAPSAFIFHGKTENHVEILYTNYNCTHVDHLDLLNKDSWSPGDSVRWSRFYIYSPTTPPPPPLTKARQPVQSCSWHICKSTDFRSFVSKLCLTSPHYYRYSNDTTLLCPPWSIQEMNLSHTFYLKVCNILLLTIQNYHIYSIIVLIYLLYLSIVYIY